MVQNGAVLVPKIVGGWSGGHNLLCLCFTDGGQTEACIVVKYPVFSNPAFTGCALTVTSTLISPRTRRSGWRPSTSAGTGSAVRRSSSCARFRFADHFIILP